MAIVVSRNSICLFLISATVLSLDHISKLLVLARMREGESAPVIPGFVYFTLRFNNGLCFGFLSKPHSNYANVPVLASMVVAVAILVVALLGLGNRLTILTVSLAMELGCCLGNLYDKVAYRGAVDFIDVHIYRYSWPAFNVADSFGTVAECMLLLYVLLFRSAARTELKNLMQTFRWTA